MNYLIFEYNHKGHFPEYLFHLINYANSQIDCNSHYYFVVNPEYKNQIDKMSLPNIITICYLGDDEIKSCESSFPIFSSFKRIKILKKYLELYNIDVLILSWILPYMPGLYLINQNISINTIEYRIPYWRGKNTRLITRIIDKFKFKLYSSNKNLRNIYLLNDKWSISYYNQKYKTDKYKYLPDPIDIKYSIPINIRKSDDKITLMHVGCLKKEKGTFELLNALQDLPPEIKCKYKLIIGGKPANEVVAELIKERIDDLKQSMSIDNHLGYVSDTELEKMYQRSDYIMIPYFNILQSSGNLGHAASFNKPVIGPKDGLLGKLISEYKLGVCLDSISSDAIYNTLISLAKSPVVQVDGAEYFKINSPQQFARLLFTQ